MKNLGKSFHSECIAVFFLTYTVLLSLLTQFSYSSDVSVFSIQHTVCQCMILHITVFNYTAVCIKFVHSEP